MASRFTHPHGGNQRKNQMKYQVKIGELTYQVVIESLSARPILATVDGTQFEVWPEENATLPSLSAPVQTQSKSTGVSLVSAHVPSGAALNVKTVRAPIPGVIVEVKVKPGDAVAFSQELFIIEAMKMRNSIRAARAGEVAEIFVSAGQTVNHDDKLLEFAE